MHSRFSAIIICSSLWQNKQPLIKRATEKRFLLALQSVTAEKRLLLALQSTFGTFIKFLNDRLLRVFITFGQLRRKIYFEIDYFHY